jgi:hypothetical protein
VISGPNLDSGAVTGIRPFPEHDVDCEITGREGIRYSNRSPEPDLRDPSGNIDVDIMGAAGKIAVAGPFGTDTIVRKTCREFDGRLHPTFMSAQVNDRRNLQMESVIPGESERTGFGVGNSGRRTGRGPSASTSR